MVEFKVRISKTTSQQYMQAFRNELEEFCNDWFGSDGVDEVEFEIIGEVL